MNFQTSTKLTGMNQRMNAVNVNTTHKKIYIEKFEAAKFSQEIIPFVQIRRDVIQQITDPLAGFIWVYLQSLPPTWKPNKKQIMKRFDISERTYERRMSFLCKSGLITYQRTRYKNGRLGAPEMIVLNGERFNPNAEAKGMPIYEIVEGEHHETHCEIKDFNHTANCDGLDAHHTAKKPGRGDLAVYINKHQEDINTTTTTEDRISNTLNSNSEVVITAEIDKKLLGLRNEYIYEDERTEGEFLKQCSHHLDNGDKQRYNLVRRLKGLETIIKSGLFETPAGYKERKTVKSIFTPEEEGLIYKYKHALRMADLGANINDFVNKAEIEESVKLLGKLNNSKPVLNCA